MTKKPKPGKNKAAPKKSAGPVPPEKGEPKAAKPAKASPPAKKTEVTITPAKGRPMLTWVGKRPLSQVTAFPAQLVERHDAVNILGIGKDNDSHDERMRVFRGLREHWNAKCWEGAPGIAVPESGGLLFHGDNKDVLAHLLASGFRSKVNLIYIDPPFDSGADYVRKVSLRGSKGTARVDGEGYSLGEQIQYTDIWANDNYLQFMYERLLLLRELLAEDGSLALHCDVRRSHFLRMLMEEIFGADNLRGEIIVRAGVKNVQSQFDEMSNLTLGHNSVFVFSKGRDTKYPTLKNVSDQQEPGKWDTFWRGTDRPTMRYELFGQTPDSGQWRWEKGRTEAAIRNYTDYLDKGPGNGSLDEYYLGELDKGRDLDFVRPSEEGVVQYYVSPRRYKILSNVWFDLPYRGTETDYPTEKNQAISERLLGWLSRPGELVVDCFVGSGTVCAVAQNLGRRWIGCDINKSAVQTAGRRLRGIISKQIAESLADKRANGDKLPNLPTSEEEKPKPCQFGFSVWRVNDYDLQIQHNEAVNIACQHVGVQRMRSDSYFDGTRRKGLVKIVPFGHPLTPLDLEELRRELDARPDEDRAITLVCLGMELAAKAWVEDWNRLRKGKDTVNRIDVIELRTDPKYGKFLVHQPATAKVTIARKEGKILVEVEDFISPTIVERLQQQGGVVAPKIDDWRAMVDCVMIDTAYNGSVFNVVLADVPEKKTDLVVGKYELAALAEESTVAVRITDMLGEEVVVTSRV